MALQYSLKSSVKNPPAARFIVRFLRVDFDCLMETSGFVNSVKTLNRCTPPPPLLKSVGTLLEAVSYFDASAQGWCNKPLILFVPCLICFVFGILWSWKLLLAGFLVWRSSLEKCICCLTMSESIPNPVFITSLFVRNPPTDWCIFKTLMLMLFGPQSKSYTLKLGPNWWSTSF